MLTSVHIIIVSSIVAKYRQTRNSFINDTHVCDYATPGNKRSPDRRC